MSIVLGTVRAIGALVIVSAAFVAVTPAAADGKVAATTIPAKANPFPAARAEINAHIEKTEEAFDAAVAEATERLKGDTGKAKSETIDKLAADATELAQQATSEPVVDFTARITTANLSVPFMYEQADIDTAIDAAKAIIDEKLATALTPVTEAVDAWAAEVAAENERIRIAEEEAARLAAEEAARQAAATRSHSPSPSRGGGGGGVSNSAPAAGESTDARINRLMGRLGIYVPYSIRECQTGNALGCYYVGSSSIVITPRGLRDDCTIMRVITHETRHMWQYNNGLIEIGPGGVTNSAWLEQDAHAHTYCF